MKELDLSSLEVNGSIWVGARKAVFYITFYGAVHGGQLHAYLVMPAGVRVHFQQVIVIRAAQQFIIELGARSALHLALECLRHVLRLIFYKIVHEISFRGGRPVLHHRPICFLDIFGAEHFIEPCKRFACARKQHDPAHRPVDAMHCSEEYLSRLLIFFLDVLLYELAQRGIACLVALHDIGRPLIDSDDVIVFVNYFGMIGQLMNYYTSISTSILFVLIGEVTAFYITDVISNGSLDVLVKIKIPS